MGQIGELAQAWQDMGVVAWAEHKFGWLMEDGKPIRLESWQRAVLEAWWE